MSVLTADRYPIDTSVEVSGQSKSPSITFAPLFNWSAPNPKDKQG